MGLPVNANVKLYSCPKTLLTESPGEGEGEGGNAVFPAHAVSRLLCLHMIFSVSDGGSLVKGRIS